MFIASESNLGMPPQLDYKSPKAGTILLLKKTKQNTTKPLWPILKNLCESNGISASLEATKELRAH